MTRIRNEVPDLYFIKCLSHTAHLIADSACKAIPERQVIFINKIAKYFNKSYKRCAEFKLMQDTFDLPIHQVLSISETRWLSLEQCILRVIEQCSALKMYFLMENNSNDDVKTIKA
jgi:hypothetical protein